MTTSTSDSDVGPTKTKDLKKNTTASNNAKSSVVAKKSSAGTSNLLFMVLPLLLAIAGGVYTTMIVPSSVVDVASPEMDARKLQTPNVGGTVEDPNDPAFAPVSNKYQSELISIKTQRLLSPSPNDKKCPVFEIVGDLTDVQEPMATGAAGLRKDGTVFFMLNGQNQGLYIKKWQPQDDCLREIALLGAEQLGADVQVLANGIKLMTPMGHPITSATQLDQQAGRIAHILLDFQLWVWPGIKVGHEFEVEGYKLKTLSIRPKVFEVLDFFTEEEAQEITRQGIDRLERSPVDSVDAVDGYHSDRTSFTAFLRDNTFTRDFRVRTATLARLPSPSFVERLQLVRYETGQFFRKHEDYFDSKQFIPKKELADQEYKAWTEWAATEIQQLTKDDNENVPEAFREGGSLFPNYDNQVEFQLALLRVFMDEVVPKDFFHEHADAPWEKWIRDNLATGASGIMTPLLADKGYMLPHIIKAWEKRVGLPELKYYIPKRPVSAVSHYFRWIRWLKERIQDLLTENPQLVPDEFKPIGRGYPTYNMAFQNVLLGYVLEDHTKEQLIQTFGEEWAKWLIENKGSKDVLWQALKVSDTIFDMVVASYTKRAGQAFAYTKPKYLQHFEPNRFVTVFLYLNECPEGGETVFPYSKERLITGIEREGMAECSEGLAVPPTKLTAAMFYAQTPENFPDRTSLHGGCPPAKGVKYGANSFAWNADADEGANAWDLGADLKVDPSAED